MFRFASTLRWEARQQELIHSARARASNRSTDVQKLERKKERTKGKKQGKEMPRRPVARRFPFVPSIYRFFAAAFFFPADEQQRRVRVIVIAIIDTAILPARVMLHVRSRARARNINIKSA